MAKKIKGQPKGVTALSKREELLREKQQREELARQRELDLQDENYFHKNISEELEQFLGWGCVCHGAKISVGTKIGGGYVVVAWVRDHLEVRLENVRVVAKSSFPSFNDAARAMIKFYRTNVELNAPSWLRQYKMVDVPYDLRIFWKEARLSGYKVIPGYSALESVGMYGPNIWALRFMDTGTLQKWHLRAYLFSGSNYTHQCFDDLEEAIDFISNSRGI